MQLQSSYNQAIACLDIGLPVCHSHWLICKRRRMHILICLLWRYPLTSIYIIQKDTFTQIHTFQNPFAGIWISKLMLIFLTNFTPSFVLDLCLICSCWSHIHRKTIPSVLYVTWCHNVICQSGERWWSTPGYTMAVECHCQLYLHMMLL